MNLEFQSISKSQFPSVLAVCCLIFIYFTFSFWFDWCLEKFVTQKKIIAIGKILYLLLHSLVFKCFFFFVLEKELCSDTVSQQKEDGC